MNDKTLVERLREHRVILKSGDYDGAQLMRAWCDMINAADTIESLQARIEALEAALREMMQAVCGENGFAAAVRNDAGKEYPWPALDIAEERAKQALESKP